MTDNTPIALPVVADSEWCDGTVKDAAGNFFCDCDDEECANLIVTAVNAHDDLVAACEAALETMDLFNIHGSVVAQLRSALAKAKEAAL